MTNSGIAMTRRRMLGILILGLSGIVMLAAFRLRGRIRMAGLRARDIVWPAKRRLLAHFDYLDLEPAGVDAYLRDYAEQIGPLWQPTEPNLYMRYLLSTDFFAHNADETRRIRYVGLYNPPFSPCVNPFARFSDAA